MRIGNEKCQEEYLKNLIKRNTFTPMKIKIYQQLLQM
jgi:hypothetical protein